MSPFAPAKEDVVKQLFSSISETYDKVNHVLSLTQDRYWRRKVVDLSDLPPKGNVLDLCTGTGDLAFEFAKRYRGSAVVGLDFAAPMLRVARKKAQLKFPEHNILFIEGDALHIPFLEESFDCITIAFGLRNVESLSKLFSEIRRVLKKGGKAIALELTRPKNLLLKALYRPYLNVLLPAVGRFISHDRSAYRYLSETIGQFYERDEVLAIMKAEGLKDLDVILRTGGVASLFIGRK